MKTRYDRKRYLSRVRQVREDVFGVENLTALTDQLEIPWRSWENYESGVVMPDLILLEFLLLTGANPGWLITGQGDVYLRHPGSDQQQKSTDSR